MLGCDAIIIMCASVSMGRAPATRVALAQVAPRRPIRGTPVVLEILTQGGECDKMTQDARMERPRRCNQQGMQQPLAALCNHIVAAASADSAAQTSHKQSKKTWSFRINLALGQHPLSKLRLH